MMFETVLQLIGGVGLFLIGMNLLTEGVKNFAGEGLRNKLVSFTGTPLKAFASGALFTTFVQSSSATIVAVIGFVSAGLLTFAQAIGIVIGASLGTTGTGWIVATIGLKINIGLYVLPFIGIGAALNLFLAPPRKYVGIALCGFGIIFIGIDTLQQAMQGVATSFDLARLPSGSLIAQFITFGIGLLLTVLMQSSSAATATTLTALHSNAISLEQAATIVIGAAVGTTITGALAAIGGNPPAKRTALAHIIFNLATGIIAVFIVPLFLYLLKQPIAQPLVNDPAIALTAFHTFFITLGVLVFFPFINSLAKFITKLVPEQQPSLTRHLDESILSSPEIATEVTSRALTKAYKLILKHYRADFTHSSPPSVGTNEIYQALDQIKLFIAKIPTNDASQELKARLTHQLHIIDHLSQLRSALNQREIITRLLQNNDFQEPKELITAIITLARSGLKPSAPKNWLATLQYDIDRLTHLRKSLRRHILEDTATNTLGTNLALDHLDAIRLIDSTAYHIGRIAHYLAQSHKPNSTRELG